jgi:RNA polymerase sigma-70 factor (ECF subfamily)
MTLPAEKDHFLSQIVEEASEGLYRYAIVLSRDRVEAQDLVQETCVRAIEAVDSLRHGANVKSWLFTILRNIWFNKLRRRRAAPRVVELDLEEAPAQNGVAASEDPHSIYVSKVERQHVREAIQQLPVEFREVLLLRAYEDLSYEDIARVLGCPRGTVMSRLGRARSKLRSLLSGKA